MGWHKKLWRVERKNNNECNNWALSSVKDQRKKERHHKNEINYANYELYLA